MRHSIALRLLAFFTAALLLFALVSGLLFKALFTKAVMDSKKAEMIARAQKMAGTLGQELSGGGQGGRGMGGPGGGYGAAVRLITQSSEDVWVLDEQLQVLSAGRMMGRTLTYDSLPPDALRLVRAVFAGEIPFSEGFSEMLGYPTLTVGMPILSGDQVAGALLMHETVAGIDKATREGQRLLVYAGAAALAVAIPLAILLSYGFIKPIRRMKAVAGRLAGGDYEAQTGLSRRDEFGDLAQSIDSLSLKLKQARDAGLAREQQRRDFLANVAHELRTPVTVLRGSLEALRDGVVTAPGQVADYHRQMLRETESLQRLVNDLMELERLQNSDFQMDMEDLDWLEVIKDALRAAARLGGEKGCRLQSALPPQALPFRGDFTRLRQMLLVALDNAVKFSPPGGDILVALDSRGIHVTDHGPGIPQEDLPFLFDRFHKTHTSQNRQGSGLGLAIARQIALRHGLTIAVESMEGQGTTVRFLFADTE